jgi:hypothetical protein
MEYAKDGHVCLLPYEKIICDGEVKSISDVKVGDKVLTHNVRFKNVTKKFERHYNGNIKIVKTRKFNLNIKTTEEHPFLVAIKNNSKYDYVWKRAKELNENDFLVYPIKRNLKSVLVSRKHYKTENPYNLFMKTQSLLKIGLIPTINLKKHTYEMIFDKNIENANIDKNYLLLPVKKVITEKYSGLIYNLEVEEDNTYATLNSIVHNCLDEFWTYIDARSSASIKNKIVGNMLLKSRKRDLTIMFTSQMLDLLDKRVRKIMDFTAYCLLNQHETIGKVFIFRSGYPKDHMLLKQFLYRTPMVFELYDTREEISMNDNDGKPPLIVFQESPDVPPKYFDTWEDADVFAEKWWEKNGKDLLPLMMEFEEK